MAIMAHEDSRMTSESLCEMWEKHKKKVVRKEKAKSKK
jgi:hypothetical protein